jgi:TldD protein
VRVSVSVIVEHNGRIEQASSGGGGRYDYRYFIDHNLAETYAHEAIRQALVALEAQDTPAGKLPVILSQHNSLVLHPPFSPLFSFVKY